MIVHLAYSPDGRSLAASLEGKNGVRLFEAGSGRETGQDRAYSGGSYSVDFSRDSRRLVTASEDGHVRLYAVEEGRLKKLAEAATSGGNDCNSFSFSPDGRQIAVGFLDTTAVNVLDGATLALAYTPDTRGVDNGDTSSVAWSADGQFLYAAGRWAVKGDNPIRRWFAGGRGAFTDIPVAGNTVQDVASLPDGGLIFAAGGPTWGVISAQGKVLRRQDPAIADFRGLFEGFRLSDDGRQVRFGYEYGGQSPSVFDIGSGLGPDRAGLAAPITSAPGLTIANWNDTHPTLNGQSLGLQDERSRSLAIAPDGKRFALGAEWSLRLFDRTARQLWEVPVPDVVWSVDISGDGRWVVAAYSDGTIRWHRISDSKEVLAFFPHADRKRWIIWTPEGFFDASPVAEGLIGYHLNRGKDQAGEFIAAKQFLERYYQPSLIAQRLDPDGDQLIADAVAKLGDVRELLAGAGGAVPLVELLSPAEAQTEGDYVLSVRVKDQGGGVGRLIYRIDGVEVQGRQVDIERGDTVSRVVRVSEGRHLIAVAAENTRGVESKPVQAVVQVNPAAERPVLYALFVGVTAYQDRTLAKGVRFAGNDAATLKAHFQEHGAKLYRAIDVRGLQDEQATHANIEKEMREFALRVGPNDVFVLYLAGHGAAFERNYHFIPWDARYTSQQALREQSLDQDTLRTLLKGIAARKTLVLLDTCSSGTFGAERGRALGDKEAMDRFSRLTGRALIAAAADDKMALEGEGGHGVFTFALLEGLRGAADHNNNGTIEVGELADYIEESIPSITKRKWNYEQFPFRDIQGASFSVMSKP